MRTIKRKVFPFVGAFALIAIASCVFFAHKTYVYGTNDSLIQANVEALSGSEQPGCTGPKKSNFWGHIYCRCENNYPCMDDYGCN